MKVQDLIKILQDFEPEALVKVSYTDDVDPGCSCCAWTTKLVTRDLDVYDVCSDGNDNVSMEF